MADAVSIRYMLCYIFNLVRTQYGNAGSARYHSLAVLKSYVSTAAVKRRNSRDAVDLSAKKRGTYVANLLANLVEQLMLGITWPYRDLCNSQYSFLGLLGWSWPAGQDTTLPPKLPHTLPPKLTGLCRDNSSQGAGLGTTRAPSRCLGKTHQKLTKTDRLLQRSRCGQGITDTN